MRQVPRERFVAASALPGSRGQTFGDWVWPNNQSTVDCGVDDRISEPGATPTYREIGAGSGYQTAILSLLAGEVVTIERFPELAFSAARRLARLGRWNIFYLVGDGTLGWPSAAPFDGILVTASSPELPRPLWAQLLKGVMVIPIGPRDEQVLYAVRKNQGQPIWYTLTPCRFVPLVGTFGWPKGAD